jgi:CRISPR-associated exonuclease Cas4
MFAEDEARLPISAIGQYGYCPRRAVLMFVEQEFAESADTIEGEAQHARADEPLTTMEDGVRVERALPLWSVGYQLSGRADIIRFLPDGAIVPVEYKHGPRRPAEYDDMQLCAQAFCLEEMFGVTVPAGRIFYQQSQRVREVAFDAALRDNTTAAITALHRHLAGALPVPPPRHDRFCHGCSLAEICRPDWLVAAVNAPDVLYRLTEEEEMA